MKSPIADKVIVLGALALAAVLALRDRGGLAITLAAADQAKMITAATMAKPAQTSALACSLLTSYPGAAKNRQPNVKIPSRFGG